VAVHGEGHRLLRRGTPHHHQEALDPRALTAPAAVFRQWCRADRTRRCGDLQRGHVQVWYGARTGMPASAAALESRPS
jgi:hypothetical protein